MGNNRRRTLLRSDMNWPIMGAYEPGMVNLKVIDEIMLIDGLEGPST